MNCRAASALLLLLASPAAAVPVVPNFSQGVVSTHTETKTIVKESIVSESHRTGWEYTVSGTGVEPSSGIVSPGVSGTGFTVTFRNSAGTAVDRTFNWQAVGYGKSD